MCMFILRKSFGTVGTMRNFLLDPFGHLKERKNYDMAIRMELHHLWTVMPLHQAFSRVKTRQ
eukprot:4168190-Amphidinium_carterae.1